MRTEKEIINVIEIYGRLIKLLGKNNNLSKLYQSYIQHLEWVLGKNFNEEDGE